MSNYSTIHLLIINSLLILSKSAIIWNDALDSANGSPLNWTIINAANVATPFNDLNPENTCPNTTNCWEFTTTSSAYYLHSTLNYHNITITYNVAALGLDGSDECNIYYSINSESIWTQIGSSWKTNTKSTSPITIKLPLNTSNTTNIGIKLSAEHVNANSNDDNCYFSNISLKGTLITTATTAAATTTPAGSTSISTTGASSRSSTSLTSYSSSTQTEPTTTSDVGSELDSDGQNIGVYIAIGAILFVVLALILCFVVYKKIGKKSNDNVKEMDIIVNENTNRVVTDNNNNNNTSNVMTSTNNQQQQTQQQTQQVQHAVVEKRIETNPKPMVISVQSQSAENTNNNNNNESSSDDSLMRKQEQYAYQEECEIENNNSDNDESVINTPLPGFDNNLTLQISSQQILMNTIMQDMNNSQLKLQTGNEVISDKQKESVNETGQ